MKDHGQFGDKPAGKAAKVPSDKLDCPAVELLWVEAVEGTLASTVAEKVRAHTSECASCREKISQARKGREWLLMLKLEPLVPPSDLVAKILAKTTGASEASRPARWSTPKIPADSDTRAAARYRLPGYSFPDTETTPIPGEIAADKESLGHEGIQAIPVWQRPSVVLLRKTVFEPRLALVAAMAFFSLSLTLNLAGVKLTSFRASDLEPQAMRRAVTRQYAQANARVVHYYENLRIVYEVESRVHQLRQAADSAPVQEKTGYSGKQGSGRDDQGRRGDRNDKSDRDGVHQERMDVTPVKDQNARRNRATPVEPVPVFTGPVIDASLTATPMSGLNVVESGRPQLRSTVLSESVCQTASQASSHLPQLARICVPERNSA